MATSMRKKLAIGIGVAGTLAAIVTTTVTPAFGSTSAASASIRISRNNGPVTLKNGDTTLVKF